MPADLTLKTRVAEFWRWYSSVAQRFYDEIEAGRCGGLEPETSAKVDELLGGMAWVFGPGADGAGHSFTLTPEGNPYRRFVAQYWLAQAPGLDGWTFYASRQRGGAESGRSFGIGGKEFSAQELWLTPWVDEQDETVELTVWHPLFDQIEDRLKWTVISLWLDEALGEDGAVNWISGIKFSDGQLADAIPLAELAEFLDEVQATHGWAKHPPHETYTGYQGREPERGQLRKDIVAGTTRHFRLIQDYPLDKNPLEEFGAEFVMVVMPTAILPGDNPVDTRGVIEDSIAGAFAADAAGYVLGGAIGIDNSYIDLLLCDGEKSRTTLRRVLAEQGIGPNARIVSFVKS